PYSGSNSGPGLQRILAEELHGEAERSILKDRADLTVEGVYRGVQYTDALNRPLLAVVLKLTVVHKGKELKILQTRIENSEDVALLLGCTGELPTRSSATSSLFSMRVCRIFSS